MSCVLIDVDGTLFARPSAERSFVAYLFRHRVLGARQVLAGLVFFLRWGLHYGLFAPHRNKAYLAGLRISTVEDLAERFVRESLLKRLRPSIVNRLKQHHEANEPILLITGAPDFIAAPLGRALGARGWRATRCAQQDDVFTSDPPECYPFRAEKLRQARELCRQLGYDLSGCVAYADSFHDLPLLQEVGRAVVVAPGRRLRRRARRQNWLIIE